MKRCISLCIAISFIFTLFPQTTVAVSAAEQPTEKWEDVAVTDWITGDTVLTITTPEQLAGLSTVPTDTLKNKKFKLGNNIDMKGKLWKTIPTFSVVELDGDGYSILNLTGTNGFIHVMNTVTIKNITFTGTMKYSKTLGMDNYSSDFGAIAGSAYDTELSNIRNYINSEVNVIEPATSSQVHENIGGMFGLVLGGGSLFKLENIENHGSISVKTSTAAGSHKLYGGSLFPSTLSIGGVTGDMVYVGKDVKNMYNYGNIEVDNNITDIRYNVGGIIGKTSTNSNSTTGTPVTNITGLGNSGSIRFVQNKIVTYSTTDTANNLVSGGSDIAVGGIVGGVEQGDRFDPAADIKSAIFNSVMNTGSIDVISAPDKNYENDYVTVGGIFGTTIQRWASETIRSRLNYSPLDTATILERYKISETNPVILKNAISSGPIHIVSLENRAPGTGSLTSIAGRAIPDLANYRNVGGIGGAGRGIILSNSVFTGGIIYEKTNKAIRASSIIPSLIMADNESMKTNYYDADANVTGDVLTFNNFEETKTAFVNQPTSKPRTDMKSGTFTDLLNTTEAGIFANRSDLNNGYPYIKTMEAFVEKSKSNNQFGKNEGDVSWESSKEPGTLVNGKYEQSAPISMKTLGIDAIYYDVSIYWGDMKFDYVKSDEAAAENGLLRGWNGMDEANNKVRVINNANLPVKTTFTLQEKETDQFKTLKIKHKLDVTKTDAGGTAVNTAGTESEAATITTGEQTIAKGEMLDAKLSLSGDPAKAVSTYKEIASLLVSISSTTAQP